MAGCVSGFGLSNVVNVRNEAVLKKLWDQSLVFDNVRFKSLVKEAAFPRLGRNIGYRHVSMKKKQRLVVMSNMSHSPAEPECGGAATTVTKEGNDGVISKDVKVLDANEGSKIDSDGNVGNMFDGNGGNGKYVSGNGGGGSDGGGDGSEENEYEEKEFGPLMKFEEVMKEVEARGATLPSDMLEAAKNVGIRKLLLLRYLDLQGSSWPLGFLIRSWGMLRNRMLADPSFLFKIGTEVCLLCFAILLNTNFVLLGVFYSYLNILTRPFMRHLLIIIENNCNKLLVCTCHLLLKTRAQFKLVNYLPKKNMKMDSKHAFSFTAKMMLSCATLFPLSIKKSEEDIPVPPLLKSAALWGVFLAISSNTRYQIVNGLERLVEASALAKQVPPVALAFTIGVRFANNVYGGMQFVDWARWSGVQ
ncbi:hypothetical protein Dsin_006147 [Dipteronia sinensis]|uniref:Uncharacterized protein n=1 Tax=Dipteronia sinensis TaxID=43782 RepID=A0AAE0EH55_9ROSI|nr:hypothetical protein Dsin_006147 [Dipteronia sinensis]